MCIDDKLDEYVGRLAPKAFTARNAQPGPTDVALWQVIRAGRITIEAMGWGMPWSEVLSRDRLAFLDRLGVPGLQALTWRGWSTIPPLGQFLFHGVFSWTDFEPWCNHRHVLLTRLLLYVEESEDIYEARTCSLCAGFVLGGGADFGWHGECVCRSTEGTAKHVPVVTCKRRGRTLFKIK